MCRLSVIGVFQQLRSADLPVSENFPLYQSVQKSRRSPRSSVFELGENLDGESYVRRVPLLAAPLSCLTHGKPPHLSALLFPTHVDARC